MRVCDYIAEFIVTQLRVDRVFMLTGGGAMFLNDGIAKRPELKPVFNHHEQACAMAAVGYAKFSGQFGVVNVTTGCGATNAITGLLDAYQDNVPCLFLSGQVKRKETLRNSGLAIRQIGVQEVDIVSIVSSLTKYAVVVNEPNDIAYHLGKAAYLAASGRPGPVWLDIPLDVQGALVDPARLRTFDATEVVKEFKEHMTEEEGRELERLLRHAQRPVVIAGNGIRLSTTMQQFRSFVERNQLPVVVSYLGVDLLPSDHPLNVGRIGIKGDRAGNFAVQNSDLVLALGTRLCVPMTGYEYGLFAREAKVVVVDIDPLEHRKNTIRIDRVINADLRCFFRDLDAITCVPWRQRCEWVLKCQHWRGIWPVCLPEYRDEQHGVNMYTFTEILSARMPDDAAVVSDAGSSYYVTSQAIRIRAEQRYITSGAQADMGFTLPAAIGVCAARGMKPVIGVTGDGSLQLNIQELQTVVHSRMPVKLFVLNNNGYMSIRATQTKFFEGRLIGTDKSSGLSFPGVARIADAYRIPYRLIDSVENARAVIDEVLALEGPVVCEVMCPENQEVVPTVSSVRRADGRMESKPLEDLYPFLSREEFRREMIVPTVDAETTV